MRRGVDFAKNSETEEEDDAQGHAAEDKIFLFLPPTDKGSLDNKFSFDEAKWLPTKRNNWIITQNPFVPPKKQTKLFLFTENLCHGQTHFSGLKELVDVGEGARS